MTLGVIVLTVARPEPKLDRKYSGSGRHGHRVRRERQAQGGRAPARRQRPLRRRHPAARHAARRVCAQRPRPCPHPRRRPQCGARHAGRASGAGLCRPAAAAARQRAAAVRAQSGDHPASHALFTGECGGRLCRRADRHRGGGEPRAGGGRRGAGRSRLRGAAGGVRLRRGGRTRKPGRAPRRRVEHCRARADQPRRHRSGVRPGRARGSRPHQYSPRRTVLHRMPRPGRQPRPGDRRLHRLHFLAGLAPHQAWTARRARSQRQPDARGDTRRRRRLRTERRDLSGISVRRRLRRKSSAGR